MNAFNPDVSTADAFTPDALTPDIPSPQEFPMYEGCNKTALTSQAAIADALLTIMKSKPYNRISVSEICKCAGVSRQTFYSLFVSKDDVISCVLARNYCFRLEEQDCCSASMSLEEICRAYSYYITQTRDILDLLVANDIMYLMQDSLYRSFITCHSYLPDHTKEDRIYAADFLAGGLTGIARNYVLQGRDTSRDHLEDILYSLFNGSFFR